VRRSEQGAKEEKEVPRALQRAHPFGGRIDRARGEEKETTLLPGDDAFFCTDGLVEAHDPREEMFGSLRLRSLVSEHPTGGMGLTSPPSWWRNWSASPGRDRSRRTTSPSLRWSAPRPEAELLRRHLQGCWVNWVNSGMKVLPTHKLWGALR
jgi:hypothetical protein